MLLLRLVRGVCAVARRYTVVSKPPSPVPNIQQLSTSVLHAREARITLKKISIPGWACAFAVLLCILATHPVAEIGLNDDWSYVFSVQRLVQTGHIAYNGWAAPVLVPQLYLGALFARLFGQSFTAVRSSCMLLGVLSTPLVYSIFTRCGIRPRNAVLGTLTLVLSPMFLTLSTTFMTDIPAMFLLLVFFYAAVRSVQSSTDGRAVGWLALAAVAGLVGGSVRQIAWLSVLLSLPALAWYERHRRRYLAAGIAMWAVSLLAVLLILHWFNQQPNTAIEKPLNLPNLRGELLHIWLPRVCQSVVSCLVLSCPVLLAIALRYPLRVRRYAFGLAVSFAAIAVLVWRIALGLPRNLWDIFLLGNYLTTSRMVWRGDVIGSYSEPLSNFQQSLIAYFVICTTVTAAWVLWHGYGRGKRPILPTDRAMLWMGLPFVAGYLALVFTRALLYDRYFLPVLFLAYLAGMRWMERHFDSQAALFSLAPLIVLAGFGVAGCHDMFVAANARIAAIQVLRDAGVPRTAILGGFEYDGWTQVETAGHVNEPRIHPSSAYHPNPLPEAWKQLHPAGYPEDVCYGFFRPYAPVIHAHYTLQGTPDYCFPHTDLPPVTYRTWLQPHSNTIYLARIPQAYW